MSSLSYSAAIFWLAFIAILAIRLAWQFFTYPEIPVDYNFRNTSLPYISVIVPARNEEDNIDCCIANIVNQDYPSELYEVIVVDDASTDNTKDIALKHSIKSHNVKLISAGEIPCGWIGKTNACQVGASIAKGDFLCFLDADTFVHSKMLTSCLSAMEKEQCDLLSITPHETMVGIAERSIMPWGFILLGLCFNFKNINNQNHPEALANGQCMFFRKHCYEVIGGHGSAKDQVLEDIFLAGVVKRNGFKLFFARGENLATTRMYRNMNNLYKGLNRILRRVLKNRRVFAIHLLITFVLAFCPIGIPILVIASSSSVCSQSLGIGLFATFIYLTICGWTCRYFKVPIRWVLFSSFGFALWGIVVLGSLVDRKKIVWKGRTIEE